MFRGSNPGILKSKKLKPTDAEPQGAIPVRQLTRRASAATLTYSPERRIPDFSHSDSDLKAEPMATSEIEKLERRYAENPHGLTFAPLAEVHRKNGDIPRALELLTAGLELHPNYIPASIVLGRCHQDLGDLPSAEAAFAHVLRLDEENVIALKSLADIGERLERYPEAEGWLRRLVAVDRSNDDAKDQLRRVEAVRQGASVQATAAPVAEPIQEDPPAPAPAPLEMIDLSPASAAPRETPVEETPEPPPVEVTALVQEPEPEPESKPEPAPPEPAVAASAPAEPAESPLPFIDGTVPEAPVPSSPAGETIPPDTAVPEPAVSGENKVQPLAGLISAEFQPPLEATGGLGVETSEEVQLEVSDYSEFSVPDASEDFKSLAARMSSPPEPVPAAQSTKPPAEEAFIAPIQEPPAPAAAEPEPVSAVPRKPAYSARETNGQSVAVFFRTMLAARLSSDAGGSSPSSGQNGSSALGYGDESLPVPPAVPTEQKSDGAVTFDDFFGPESDEATPLRQGKGDSGKDDLDQFQSWLQNLKR